MVTLPVFGISRHRMTIDGVGVTTLVGGYGCPLKCKYCINADAWDPKTLAVCKTYTPEQLYEELKIDDLYFRATGGGVTFGGGESLLHAVFIREFKQYCPNWSIVLETSLNVPEEHLRMVLDVADEFIVDIKDMNPEIYRAYTSVSNEKVLKNLQILSTVNDSKRILIRVPSIPNHGNEPKDIENSIKILKDMGFEHFDIFPYIDFSKK